METLRELIAKSSESRLLAYEFAGGFLRLELDLDVPDADVLITIVTTSVIAKLDLPGLTGRVCHLFLEPLDGLLAVENGRYMPPTGFVEMMKLSRKHAHLAFGAKATPTACFVRCGLLDATDYVSGDRREAHLIRSARARESSRRLTRLQ